MIKSISYIVLTQFFNFNQPGYLFLYTQVWVKYGQNQILG